MNWIAEPWRSELVARAGIELIVVAVLCGALGVFVILRGLSYAGDAFAHAVFPGAVAAATVGASIRLGALATAIPASILVTWLGQRLSGDAAIGIVMAVALAVGAIVLSSGAAEGYDVESFLFGTPLGVSDGDLTTSMVSMLCVVTFLAGAGRALVASTMDPAFAASSGIPVRALDMALLAAIAVATVVAVHAVGTLLVLALIVTPAATARMLSRRLLPLAGLSVAIAALAGVAGLYTSYYWGVALGGATVLWATGAFALALGLDGLRRAGSRHDGRRYWQAAQRP